MISESSGSVKAKTSWNKSNQRYMKIYDERYKRPYRMELPEPDDNDSDEHDGSMVRKSGVYKSSSHCCSGAVPCLEEGASEKQKLSSFRESLQSLRSSCANFQDWTKSRCRSSSVPTYLLSSKDVQSRSGHLKRNESLLSSLQLTNLSLTEQRSKDMEKASPVKIQNITVIAETKPSCEPYSSKSSNNASTAVTCNTESPPKKSRMSDERDSMTDGSSNTSSSSGRNFQIQTSCENGNGSSNSINTPKKLIEMKAEIINKLTNELPTLRAPSSPSTSTSSIEATDYVSTPLQKSEVVGYSAKTAASKNRSNNQFAERKAEDVGNNDDDIVEVIELEPVQSKLIPARKRLDNLKSSFRKYKTVDDDLEIIHEKLVSSSSVPGRVKSDALPHKMRTQKQKPPADGNCVTISDDDSDHDIEITQVHIAKKPVKFDSQSDDCVIVLD